MNRKGWHKEYSEHAIASHGIAIRSRAPQKGNLPRDSQVRSSLTEREQTIQNFRKKQIKSEVQSSIPLDPFKDKSLKAIFRSRTDIDLINKPSVRETKSRLFLRDLYHLMRQSNNANDFVLGSYQDGVEDFFFSYSKSRLSEEDLQVMEIKRVAVENLLLEQRLDRSKNVSEFAKETGVDHSYLIGFLSGMYTQFSLGIEQPRAGLKFDPSDMETVAKEVIPEMLKNDDKKRYVAFHEYDPRFPEQRGITNLDDPASDPILYDKFLNNTSRVKKFILRELTYRILTSTSFSGSASETLRDTEVKRIKQDLDERYPFFESSEYVEELDEQFEKFPDSIIELEGDLPGISRKVRTAISIKEGQEALITKRKEDVKRLEIEDKRQKELLTKLLDKIQKGEKLSSDELRDSGSLSKPRRKQLDDLLESRKAVRSKITPEETAFSQASFGIRRGQRRRRNRR
jgi:hypothetical protein